MELNIHASVKIRLAHASRGADKQHLKTALCALVRMVHLFFLRGSR